MDPIDITILVLYFAFVTGVGFWYQRRAARDLESYFLGGKSMHWLTLAMSGAVSNFDISGTMWIVALISLFGMRSMWNHWVWGFLMGAFFMSFMGKWVRRSGVMTGAEWMVTRFGSGPAGTTARISYTIIAVVTLVGFLGYAFQGIGKFTTIFIDFGLEDQTASTRVAALGIFGIATLYVLLGGLYSLVITNVIQTILLTAAALIIAAVAYVNVSPDQLAEVLPADWTSLMPVWHWSDPASLPEAYAGYEWFGALVLVWVVKGLLLNLGGPGQMYDFQIFLAARDPRDAAKVGAAWSGFLLVRWAMTMGIAMLALTGIGSVEDPERVMPVVLGSVPLARRSRLRALRACFRRFYRRTARWSTRRRPTWFAICGSRSSPRKPARRTWFGQAIWRPSAWLWSASRSAGTPSRYARFGTGS